MNVKTRLFASIRAIGLLLVMNGYAQLPVRAGTGYDIGFMNKTGRDLDGVCVYYGEVKAAEAGGLVKGGEATDGLITLPVPSAADMRWIDNGQSHSVNVKLEGVVPKRLTDEWTLYLVINADGTVQAKALKYNDEAGYAELAKGLRPEGEYHLGFVNKTGHDLKDISVNNGATKMGRPNLQGGDIPVRVKVAYSDPLPPPIPAEAEVRWSGEGGASQSVKVKLDGVPKGFDGIIYLVIKPDNTVEVHPVKNGDDKEAFKVVK
jgi:hypothetical protein